MALCIDYIRRDNGELIENSYAKITGINLNTKNSEVFIHLEYFKNKTKSDEGKMSEGQYTNSFISQNPDGNLREQAYVYLKMLPEFFGASDILE